MLCQQTFAQRVVEGVPVMTKAGGQLQMRCAALHQAGLAVATAQVQLDGGHPGVAQTAAQGGQIVDLQQTHGEVTSKARKLW